ncbi:hypothetical protein J2W24_004668 [Variovorax boronicumulans]|nr:hypothetical protein [Variovorax boronicumulans]
MADPELLGSPSTSIFVLSNRSPFAAKLAVVVPR